MQLKVTHVTVLHGGSGTDTITLQLDLPPTMWPWRDGATCDIKVAHGHGVGYAEQHFPGVPRTQISLDTGKIEKFEGGGG